MKISTKGRYALRLMLDLALQDSDEYISIKSVSARQEISEKYLEQIITALVRAGFVKSQRGPQGGYRLTRRADEYTVGEILRQIEGSLAPVACMDEEPNRCPRRDQCATLEVWEEVDRAVSGVIDRTTLGDLVTRQRSKSKD